MELFEAKSMFNRFPQYRDRKLGNHGRLVSHERIVTELRDRESNCFIKRLSLDFDDVMNALHVLETYATAIPPHG